MRLRAALASLVLLAAGPAAAIGLTSPVVTPSSLSTATVQWRWTLTSDATGYRVLSSTGGGNISGDLSGITTYFALTGLSTNTAAAVTVQGFGPGGVGNSALSTAYSAAAAPSGSQLLAQAAAGETLSWATNGNPAGTSYQVFWSSAGGTPTAFSTTPAIVAGSATATVPGLPGGYILYFQVLALNGGREPTAFDVQLSTYVGTLYGQPVLSSGTYALGTSSIAWSWSASTGALNYRLFSASGGAVSPLLGPAVLSYIQTGLTPNTSYLNFVTAYSVDGAAVQTSTQSAPFARYTLAARPSGLSAFRLHDAFEDLSWSANSNPAYTGYDVLWWTGVTSTVTYSTASVTTTAGVLPAGGTVYFTVRARNYEGIATDFDPTLYAAVPSTYFAVGVTTIAPNFSGTLTFAVPTGPVTLTVSSGTFGSQAALSILTPSAPPAVAAPFTALGTPIAFTITAVDPFGALLQPLKPIAIGISYQPGVLGGVSPLNATVARYDSVHGAWVPLLTQRQGSSLSALTEHLTPFQVLGLTAPSDLASVSVGPNPLRPYLNPGTPFTFRGVPAGARIRVFTILGEKVADLRADASGLATWDGRNPYGSFVGSGVYLAVLEGPGKRTFRLAVER